jgi:alanine racemase
MSLSRRSFVRSTTLAAAALASPGPGVLRPDEPPGRTEDRLPSAPNGSDPWLEIRPDALRRNAAEVARLSGGQPVMAVVKNNAYGLGLEVAGPALAEAPEVAGLAVVKVDEAIRLREAGVRKPILLMTRATDGELRDLVRLGVSLSPFHDDEGGRLEALSAELQRPIPVHLYLDTGMSRLGMPYHRALPWMEDLAGRDGVRIEGAYMGFTEDREFDREQLDRFLALAGEARSRGVDLGRLHAASSNAVTFLDEAHLDMVRPGLMLFGAHVAGGREASEARLTPALRLRARVVRVEELRPGDTVSYGRNYTAGEPTWVATIPVGHADGYPRQAVDGCRVLVGERSYPVIGAVSASHTIIEVGREPTVRVGEVATLLGPDHPDIHPNELSERTGRSVYDILMHLDPLLPKVAWEA